MKIKGFDQKRLNEFKARLRWAQDQWSDDGIVIYACHHEGVDVPFSGVIGQTSQEDSCFAAAIAIVHLCATEYAEAHEIDSEAYWAHLLKRVSNFEGVEP